MTPPHPAVEIPAKMRALPRDKHGRPVPWFVHWSGERDGDGEPDFRVIGHDKLTQATWFDRCWVCGTHRGRHASFLIGPMCAVNRVSSEPPSHLNCATYSARACPFMANPSMRRRDRGLPGTLQDRTPGIAIERNPGVGLVWSSRTWKPFTVPIPAGPNGERTAGVLWDIGEPTAVAWWREGRPATRAEVEDSINTGLPALEAMCEEDQFPTRSRAHLAASVARARDLLPA